MTQASEKPQQQTDEVKEAVLRIAELVDQCELENACIHLASFVRLVVSRREREQQAAQPAPPQLGTCRKGNLHGHMLPHRLMLECDDWRPEAQPAPEELEAAILRVMTAGFNRFCNSEKVAAMIASLVRQREAAKDNEIASLKETLVIISCEPDVEKLRRSIEQLNRGEAVSFEEAFNEERTPLREALDSEQSFKDGYAKAATELLTSVGKVTKDAADKARLEEAEWWFKNTQSIGDVAVDASFKRISDRRAALAPPAQEEKK